MYPIDIGTDCFIHCQHVGLEIRVIFHVIWNEIVILQHETPPKLTCCPFYIYVHVQVKQHGVNKTVVEVLVGALLFFGLFVLYF